MPRAAAIEAWLPKHWIARAIDSIPHIIGIADAQRNGIACYRFNLLKFLMLSGNELGEALKEAMTLKGVTQQQVAKHFSVTQSSVSEWIRYGRIAKRHLVELVTYFREVVPPQHWGLSADFDPMAAAANLPQRERELLALFGELDPTQQRALLKLLARPERLTALSDEATLSERAYRAAARFDAVDPASQPMLAALWENVRALVMEGVAVQVTAAPLGGAAASDRRAGAPT